MMRDTLPNSSPPADEPIGIERARAYIAWISEHPRLVLAETERLVNAREPGSEMRRAGANVEQFAEWRTWEGMEGLSIGCVWCKYMAGSFATADIVITR